MLPHTVLAIEVLILLNIVGLQPNAEEMIPQLAHVTLHPVYLQRSYWSGTLKILSNVMMPTCFPVGLLHLGLLAEQSSSESAAAISARLASSFFFFLIKTLSVIIRRTNDDGPHFLPLPLLC